MLRALAKTTRRPPQTLARIRRGHPLARGLIAAHTPYSGTVDRTNALPLVQGADGLGFSNSGSITGSWKSRPGAGVASAHPTWTILAVVNGLSNGTEGAVYFERPNTAQMIGLSIRDDPAHANYPRLIVRDNGQLGGFVITRGGTPPSALINGRSVIAATRLGTTHHRLYLNGAFLNSDTTTVCPNDFIDTVGQIANDEIDDPSLRLIIASVPLVLLWNRPLSDEDIARISANPWQIFRSGNRKLLFGGSSAASVTVEPGAGSVALVGYAPTIAQPKTAAPGAGVVSIVGYAPTIAQPQTAAPGVGTVALVGHAPTVTLATNVAPGAGIVAVTGYAPSIAQPKAASPGAGVVAIAGYAPSITQPQTANPGAGTVAIAGYAPAVTQSANQAVQPATGIATIAGHAPSVTQSAHQAVAPGTGPVVITGFAPSVTQASGPNSVAPGAGPVAITGHAPTVAQTGGPVVGGGNAGFEIGGGSEHRRIREVHFKPLLQRALEAKGPHVRPVKERARKRAKAIEVQAAHLVIEDGSEAQLGTLLSQWIAQRPVLPAAADPQEIFMAQVVFRLQQMDALQQVLVALAAMDQDDEDALLALLLA